MTQSLGTRMTAPIRTVEENQPVSPLPTQSYDYVPSVVIPLEKMVENLQILDEIRKKILRPGVDYDTIPGTDKPVLHKPGAERLLQFFGLGHRVECIDKHEDWENGFFYYRYRVSIIKQYPGYSITVAECEGSANSKESRYRDRWVTEKKLKELGLSPIGLETRTKTGKYGDYLEYKIENPDPYTLVNTLQKMAIKRALVGATLQATATSGFFTQDLEDMDLPPSMDSKPSNKQTDRSNTKTGNGTSAPANKAAKEEPLSSQAPESMESATTGGTISGTIRGTVTQVEGCSLKDRSGTEYAAYRIVLDTGESVLVSETHPTVHVLREGCAVTFSKVRKWNDLLVVPNDGEILIQNGITAEDLVGTGAGDGRHVYAS